jgi:type IV pilus assembly protein PilC
MSKFKYAGVTADGAAVSGVVEADHVNDARVALADKGLYGLRVKERPSIWKMELKPKKVKRAEIMNFSRQLAAFVRAGIPILDAIDTLRAEAGNERFRLVLAEICESLRTGDTLSAAVGGHPDVFPQFYVTILRSAELTGHVDEVLDQLATYIERDEFARRKIKSAMTYPLVIMAVAAIAVIVIVTFALPRFRTFFDSLNAKLPLITRILMSITNFIGDYWWLLAGVAIVIVSATWLYIRTPKGHHKKDSFLLRAPVVGDLVRFAIVERFCRILASMVKSGVQVPEAMAIASGSTNNLIYQEALEGAREAMLRGEGMSGPITDTGLFPGGVCQMIRVGEDTGTLDDQLETAAQFYGKEVEYKLDKLTALFEPMMILFVGLIVGFVAVALVSAMYGIFNQIKVAK